MPLRMAAHAMKVHARIMLQDLEFENVFRYDQHYGSV
jgi:hypothetical protein